MTFSYDHDADVLYVTFGESPKAVYIEKEEGDIIILDKESGRILGCTVMFFRARLKRGPIIIPEVGIVPFNEIAAELLESRRKKPSRRHGS